MSSEVLLKADIDINEQGGYGKGYAVLTKDSVGFYTEESAHPVFYRLEELTDLKVENCVGCNMLTAKQEEATVYLARFTNACLTKMLQLVKGVEQLKKGEEYTPPEEEELVCPKCGRRYPDPARKICPNCMDKKAVFWRVLHYFKAYKVQVVLLFTGIFMMAVLNLVWPYLNGTVLYDKVLAKDEGFLQSLGLRQGSYLTALLLLVLAMTAAKVVQLLFQILMGVVTAKMVVGVVRDIKKDVFRKMGRLSIGFYRSRQTGGLMTRVLSDAEQITGFFVDGVPYILVHSITTVATLAVMFSLNWKMSLLAVVMLPFLLLINMKMRPKLWIMHGRRHRAERSVNSILNDNLTGARVVKSFGQERQEMKRFKGNNRRLQEAETRIAYRRSFFNVVYNGTQSVLSIGVWVIGVILLMRGDHMDLGLLITFTGYVGQLQGPMSFFAEVLNWWSESMNSAQRIFEIIDAIPQVQESEHPTPLPEMKGEICLDHVTFGYEVNRPVLKDMSLRVKPGSMLGIVGRSGAGKTTLVNLISRMYDVQEGGIFIDGVNVKDLSFADLRKNVAMVSQDTYIFMGTVAQNIAYANTDATNEQIMQAAKLAGAHDFIMKMPDGYDTCVGSSGRGLSGGEKQRISIARAILANPKILILDEATASVDTETERVIQKSLQYLVQGRTTISIAHRLSTLRDADYLVVIENGEIKEQGTHEELKELGGIYYKLMELQTKALTVEQD